MTFASKSLLLAAVLAAVLSGVLWHRLDSTRLDNQTLRRELQTQQQARNTAEWLLHGQEQTMQVFSAIRAANRAARLADEAEHHDAKEKITAAITGDDCSTRPVPAVAADRLRELEKRTRAIGGDPARN
ncbi:MULTISPECIES: DUF2570 domain-containing protein [Enterobacteriaceae]|uniref:DUF2570 domain-containing protein n=1 Tax=Enterobacteriaceae TaxID=543 RepID=UPI000BE1CE7F|nr:MULTISPECIES: DUF2570 domain-containing protein [Enterobacteriaceae]EHD3373316.1 DUF2570 domain-containing protein [Escherichia coli O124]EFJ9898823.1 DUF2570 domain-containing protein [Escherichia coli]EFK6675889.1 DUF2570 domain-containing protein [Escherichia coli]EFK6760431.1 DUF2570 domain-containing protein [Escherichia coli]EGO9721959.1 DUF2570 domain-containing protein [Escherichia coli]